MLIFHRSWCSNDWERLLVQMERMSGSHLADLGSNPFGGDLGVGGLKKFSRLFRVSKAQVKGPAHSLGNEPLCAGGTWGSGVCPLTG